MTGVTMAAGVPSSTGKGSGGGPGDPKTSRIGRLFLYSSIHSYPSTGLWDVVLIAHALPGL